MQRFRGGLVFKAHRLCVSLNSRLESNKEEKNKPGEFRGVRGFREFRGVSRSSGYGVYEVHWARYRATCER